MKNGLLPASLLLATIFAHADFQAASPLTIMEITPPPPKNGNPSPKARMPTPNSTWVYYSLAGKACRGTPQSSRVVSESGRAGRRCRRVHPAVLYANGQDVKQDNAEAAKWFTRAAEAGMVEAAASLGDLYCSDDGLAKDFAQAEKWYRLAAEKGIPAAEFGLGLIYDLEQNYATAIDWYTKAAQSGYAPAMTNLGVLYYNAQGEK